MSVKMAIDAMESQLFNPVSYKSRNLICALVALLTRIFLKKLFSEFLLHFFLVKFQSSPAFFSLFTIGTVILR